MANGAGAGSYAQSCRLTASWEYISPGGGCGLQNRWAASDGVAGGFDSHVLPPHNFAFLCDFQD